MRTSKTVAGRRPQHKCRVISSEFCISETEVQACISVGLLHSKGAVQLNNCQNESFWLPTRKVADKPAKQKTKEDLSVTLPLQMKCSAVPGCSGDQEESVHVWLLPAKANTTKSFSCFPWTSPFCFSRLFIKPKWHRSKNGFRLVFTEPSLTWIC